MKRWTKPTCAKLTLSAIEMRWTNTWSTLEDGLAYFESTGHHFYDDCDQDNQASFDDQIQSNLLDVLSAEIAMQTSTDIIVEGREF